MINKILEKYSLFSFIKQEAINKFQDFERKAKREVFLKNPFFKFEEYLKEIKGKKINYEILVEVLNKYENLTQLAKIPFERNFWEKELKKANKSRNEFILVRKLLLDKFEKDLYKEKSKWELEELNRLRKEFFKNLEKWLTLIEEFYLEFKKFDETGILFDLSKGDISLEDIETIKKYLNFLQKEEIKNLADLIGKMRSTKKELEEVSVFESKTFERTLPDPFMKEETIGIKISNEIENVVPYELSLLQDDELSILFDKKFVENELMCFDLRGYTTKIEEKEIELKKKQEKKEKLGPIILCIDTSGSMSGTPENIAKALALFIANRAKEQKRDCLLINFSTSIEVFEFSEEIGIKKLIEFLKKSFHCGTNVAPALEYAVEKMKSKKYKKADVLVISDFLMSNIPKSLQEEIKNLKKEENKFYSLIIGNVFLDNKLEEIFDREWVYDFSRASIKELVKFSKVI